MRTEKEVAMAEENNQVLEHENIRLREALRKIKEHQYEIQKILDEVGDLLTVSEEVESTPVTDEDVKNLLKKYSRLI